jgi:hypothetical protein
MTPDELTSETTKSPVGIAALNIGRDRMACISPEERQPKRTETTETRATAPLRLTCTPRGAPTYAERALPSGTQLLEIRCAAMVLVQQAGGKVYEPGSRAWRKSGGVSAGAALFPSKSSVGPRGLFFARHPECMDALETLRY